MKIKKTVLVQIIKEETEKVLMEQEVTNLPPLSVPRPEGYPTEEELGYLASLGMDDELSAAGGSTLASPENQEVIESLYYILIQSIFHTLIWAIIVQQIEKNMYQSTASNLNNFQN